MGYGEGCCRARAPIETLASRIEGQLTLETLDRLGQHELTRHTRDLLTAFLRPAWMSTEGVIGHARQFFEHLGKEERRHRRRSPPPKHLTSRQSRSATTSRMRCSIS
jgi:hypothetical protein